MIVYDTVTVAFCDSLCDSVRHKHRGRKYLETLASRGAFWRGSFKVDSGSIESNPRSNQTKSKSVF